MSDPLAVSLVCVDLASIVIDDTVVERAFAEAIATQGIVAGTEAYVRAMVRFDRARGRPPADVIAEFFGTDEPRGQAASLAFDLSFNAAADRFGVTVPPDASAAFAKISGSGAKVCLLSALSRDACSGILDRLRRECPVDLVLHTGDSLRGFPWPDPVLTAMTRTGTDDAIQVAVISASTSGVLSGHRAGARIVAGIGRGSRRLTALRGAGASHVLDNIAALPDLMIGAA
jgi:beta-phosphoglucomutase-like phosphatase (HAD superfamily)